jgi:hypothetical protein
MIHKWIDHTSTHYPLVVYPSLARVPLCLCLSLSPRDYASLDIFFLLCLRAIMPLQIFALYLSLYSCSCFGPRAFRRVSDEPMTISHRC